MSTMKDVTDKISRISPGTILTYRDFQPLDTTSAAALAKALSRLSKRGDIKRLSRGRYYKPIKTRFGEAKPGEAHIINSFTFKNGKAVAYKTGPALYHEMGLTTQIPNEVVIASTQSGRKLPSSHALRIRNVKSSVRPTARNIRFLQLLDAIRDIKKIPDTSPDDSVKRLIDLISMLDKGDTGTLIATSLHYPPATRALLGAMLDKLGRETGPIKKSLNSLTSYRIGITDEVLPTRRNWNIT